MNNSKARKFVHGVLVAVMIPFVLTACSNNKSNPQTLASLFGGKKSNDTVAVPRQNALQVTPEGEVSQKPDDGNHAKGQSFASLSDSTPAANVISNQTKFSSKTFGVAGSPRVANTIEVRKGGGRYHVGKPYTIRGIRYVPKEDTDYRAVGLASWYGPNFHGRLTANGEVYDQFALSAAHPTMPLPSYARVTNMENGSSITVRVNDRGPFARGRVIDLSSRAAQLLGYTKKGVAKVKVEYVGKARMDGLDEEQLLATYQPGQLDPTAIPANPGRSLALASADPNSLPSVGQRKSLDALDQQSASAQKVSALTVVRPASLVNGYSPEKQGNLAVSKLEAVSQASDINAPSQGMADLTRIKIGPISSKSDLFHFSELAAEHGPVSILSDASETSFTIEVVLPLSSVADLQKMLNSAN